MTLESQGADSPLDIIASLGTSEPQPEATPETPAEPAAPSEPVATPEPEAPPVSEAPKAEPQDDVQAELDRLKRVIAQDPNLRANYMAEKFGHLQPQPIVQQPAPVYQPPQQQQPQFQPPVQQQAPQLPFDPAEYDPLDPSHQVALVTHIMQQQLAPFSEFVNQSKQQEAHYQQQQAQQRIDQLESEIRAKLNTVLPGFAESFKPTATFEQQMLRDSAINAFSRQMEQYPQEYWGNPAVHQDVINKIAPQLNQAAQRLGLLTAQSSTANDAAQAMAREMQVVSGNAVPVSTANPFTKAAEQGDLLGMMAAVSKVK
jgi:hypothetical protein